jgi:hypothetical protein
VKQRQNFVLEKIKERNENRMSRLDFVKYTDIFLTLNIVHTYSLCSILKNTDQCIVSCYAANYTERQRF